MSEAWGVSQPEQPFIQGQEVVRLLVLVNSALRDRHHSNASLETFMMFSF